MNILLIIVAAIFLIAAVIGYKKGFIRIAASLATTIITIVLVVALAPTASKFIVKTFPIEDMVREKVTILSDGNVSKEEQITFIESTELPEALQQLLLANNNKEIYENLGVATFSDYVAKYLASLIANVVSYIILWIIVSVAVRLLVGALKFIDKIPLVGTVNRVAGAVAGLVHALIIVWSLFLIITLAYNTEIGKLCFDNITASPILTKLYDNNILMEYLTKFMG